MSESPEKRFVGRSGVAVLRVALVLSLFACVALAATPEGGVLTASEAASKDELEKRGKKDVPPGQANRGCSIGKDRFETGALNPANECQSCQSAVDRFAWTDRVDGATCSVGVCVDAACCTPLPVDECGPEQCELVDDGCGGFTDCGSCLEARDDRIQFTEPVNANGLTVYPLSPLDNDLIIDEDAAQIVSVTQAVFNACDQPTEYTGWGHWTAPCWRQLGIISIDPGGKGLELNLNPGTAPLWNPFWPYFSKESAWAPSDGFGVVLRSDDCKNRKGTVEPDNVATTGTAANPALLCIASNEANVFLAKLPIPPLSSTNGTCDMKAEPWDIPFEYTVSDGVHESTATVTLNMYTPGCQPLPDGAFDPNKLLILHPPIVPNLIHHQLIVQMMVPTQKDGDGTLAQTGPSIALDASLAPFQFLDLVIEGQKIDGHSVILPATCPVVAGVEFDACRVAGSFIIDPTVAALFVGDATGTVVRLTEPLTVSSGPLDQRTFRSVEIIGGCLDCDLDFRTRHFAALFNIHGQCTRIVNGQEKPVWCDTGTPCENEFETLHHYCRGGRAFGIPETCSPGECLVDGD